MGKIKDITGVRSDMLVAVEFHSLKPVSGKNHAWWICRCDCGATCIKPGYQLTARMLKSCGCLARAGNQPNATHGHSRHRRASPEYGSYYAMRARCLNPKHKDWNLYGGKGVKICDRWLHGENGMTGFECFFADMGHRPKGMTLDRYPDQAGDYEPGNVRWASTPEQNANRTISVKVGGKTLRQIADISGLSYAAVHGRYYSGARTIAELTASPNPNHLWKNNGRTVVDRRTGEIVGGRQP